MLYTHGYHTSLVCSIIMKNAKLLVWKFNWFISHVQFSTASNKVTTHLQTYFLKGLLYRKTNNGYLKEMIQTLNFDKKKSKMADDCSHSNRFIIINIGMARQKNLENRFLK